MSINYSEKIPNNVNLANDRKLQRALEHWQPHFLKWWDEQGPSDFQSNDVYLRTRSESMRKVGRVTVTLKCQIIAGVSFLLTKFRIEKSGSGTITENLCGSKSLVNSAHSSDGLS